MPFDWAGLFGVIGPISICILFIILGLLSRRLGRVTRAGPYYVGLFAAAVLVGVSVLIRLWVVVGGVPLGSDLALVIDGLMALGVTLGTMVTWRYWSWLLSERG